MSLNATNSHLDTFTQIQNTCKGVVSTIGGVFVMFHAGALTYERIYNDFIPKIKTAINALPDSAEFTELFKSDIDGLASVLCGASNYSTDYQALEILMGELLVLAEDSIPKDENGFALVLKDGGSDVIPEMLDISAKLDEIVLIIG